MHPSRIAFLVLLIHVPLAWSQTVLFDFNENNGSGGPGGVWNTYATPAGINGSAAVDLTGSLTGITLSFTGTMTDNTANMGLVVFDPNQAGFVGLPSWATATDNNSASGDNFFTANAAALLDSFTLNFGGLSAGTVISLDLLAARNSASALGFYEYSLNGGSTWTGFTVLNADGTLATTNGWNTNTTQTQSFSLQTQGFALHRYLHFDNVVLSGTSFQVRVTDANTTPSTFSSVNAMRLIAVPEPGSAGLLALAGLGWLARRRR